METWFIGGGRVYDKFLVDAFQSRQIPLQSLSETQFSQLFLEYILQETPTLNVIVDVNCTSSIHLMEKTLRKYVSKRHEVRIILLSDFSTWGGKCYLSSITDFETEFMDRHPLACAHEQFRLENLLARFAYECHVNFCVVCSGILYGDAGMEVESILSYLWEQDVNQKDSDDSTSVKDLTLECDPTTVVPLTYVTSLTNQVVDLTICLDKWPSFVAVIDKPVCGLAQPFSDKVSALDVFINGPRKRNSISTAEVATTCNTRQALWKCNIPVAAAAVVASDGLAAAVHPSFEVDGFAPVWAEFVAAKALDPVYVLVAGPPRTGKSELAHRIADILQVELITIESAVKFANSFDVKEPSEEEMASQSRDSFLWAIKGELRGAVEAKANEGKKPAKGAPAAAASTECVISDDAFTPALCQSLSAELLRKCVSIQVQLHPRCRRRGFVLDLWGSSSNHLVSGAESLADTLNVLSLADKPLRHIHLAVELHCRAGLPVERLLASQGAQAKAKESQAAVKALESIVTAYNADLVPLPSADDINGPSAPSDEHMKMGHKGVQEILEQSRNESGVAVTAVSRVDLSSADSSLPPSSSSSWEAEAAARALQTLLTLRGGRIGWLLFPTSSSSKETATKASTEFTGSLVELTDTSLNAAPEGAPTVNLPVGEMDNNPKPTGSLNDQLKELDTVKLQTLTQKAEKLQAFLSATVLPQLAESLVRIQREQPADPIMFLAEQLARCSAEKHRQAQDRAYARFMELLQQGEF